jgi:elongation factor P
VEQAFIDRRAYEYLYRVGDMFTLMDPDSYDQIEVPLEKVEALLPFLKENHMVHVASWQGKVLYINLPDFVELAVTEAEPAVKGDTAGNLVKQCTVETGTRIKVPHFVEAGMTIKIDTRTGTYVSRV